MKTGVKGLSVKKGTPGRTGNASVKGTTTFSGPKASRPAPTQGSRHRGNNSTAVHLSKKRPSSYKRSSY